MMGSWSILKVETMVKELYNGSYLVYSQDNSYIYSFKSQASII